MPSGCVVRTALRRLSAASIALVVGLLLVPPVASATPPAAPDDLPQLWGVVVDGDGLAALDRGTARKLRGAGAMVIADRRHLTAAQEGRLVDLSGAAGLELFEPVPARDASASAVACAAAKAARPAGRCGVMAESGAAAKAIAGSAMTDLVVAPAAAPRRLAGMAPSGAAARVVGVLRLTGGRYRPAAWRRAIAVANASPALDLAVRPAGAGSRGSLRRFLAQVRSQGDSDRTAPAKPAPAASAAGAGSVALAWGKRLGAAAYGLYRDGARTGATTGTTARFDGLSCGAHVLEVDAVDRAGNRSAKTAVGAGPSGCGPLVPPAIAPLPGPGPRTNPSPQPQPQPEPQPQGDTSPPTAPGDLTAPVVTADGITLAWKASQDDRAVAGYRVLRGGAAPQVTTATTAVLTGLACGTAYALAVEAYDVAGNTSPKAEIDVATAACPDATAPSVPSDLKKTSATQTSVTLSWSPSTDAVGVTGYRVYRGGVLVREQAATTITVDDLACGTGYAFAVEAFDGAGNTSARATLDAATVACPGPPPTGMTVTEETRTTLTLTWTAPAGGDVVAYRVYRDGALVDTVPFATVMLQDLTCATSYAIEVAAVPASGVPSERAGISATTRACADVTPPTTPGGLQVAEVTASAVSLSWTGSTDAVGVAGYRILGGGELLETLSASATGATLELGCGRTVTLRVRAFDAAGNESEPAEKTASTLPCPDEQAPTMPESLAATDMTANGLTLTWAPSQDDVGVTRYDVYSEGQLIGSPTGTSLAVGALQCESRYAFGVEARDAAGNVSDRAFLLARTGKCPDLEPPSRPGDLRRTASTPTTLTVAWDPSTDDIGVAGYRVSLDGGPFEQTDGTSATFDQLKCGSSHTVEVEAFDASGKASERAALATGPAECDTVPPSRPEQLSVVSRDRDSIVLEWAVAADDWRTARYHVDRDGVMAGATAGSSLVVPGLACGRSYELGVRAFDAAGNASQRGALTASTADCPAGEPERPPADLFVAPDGSDQAPCTAAEPCRTFQRAYVAASPGEVVEAAAGAYGAQRILGVTGRAGPDVTIRPADGARVTFTQLALGDIGDDRATGPAHLTLRGLSAEFREAEPGGGNQGGIFIGPGSSHVTLDDMDAGSFQATRADHLTIRGGDYGPCDAVWGMPAAQICGNNVLDSSTDVLVDGARIHDYRFDETCMTVEGAECHWECMYVNGGQRVTIRNSRIYGCSIYDIFATISGPVAGEMGHKDLTIENNWLATPWAEDDEGGAPVREAAIALSWCQNSALGYRDVSLRFNSFEAGTSIELDRNPACTFENVEVVGNLKAWDGCHDQWSFAYNVLSTQLRTGTCSDTDRVVGEELPYVRARGGATMDFHLAGPAGAADDLVPAARCPATDADGQARAAGGACDAGADERGP